MMPQFDKQLKVGIVGAGVAGLAAGYDLANAGHQVTIFESAPFVGGQASTIEISGGRLERGYHHIFKNDTTIQEFMQELGLAHQMQWFPSSVGTYLNNNLYPTTTPLHLLRFNALSVTDRVRLGLAMLKLRRKRSWQDLETVTAAQWLIEQLGLNAYSTLWQPLLRGKFGKWHDSIGMPWFWAKIQTRFASRNRFGKELLGYPRNSFDEINWALQQQIINHGGKVLLENRVTKITSNGDSVELQVEPKDTNKITQQFDCVLCTAPSFEAVKIMALPTAYAAKLNQSVYLAAVVIILELTHKLSPFYWVNIADTDIPFLGLIEHTNLVPRDWYDGSHLLYITNYLDRNDPLYALTPTELLDVYLPYLQKINHDFDRAWIKRNHYNSVSAAQPIVGTNYSRVIPDHRTPLPRVYLGNTTQIYPEDRGVNYSLKMGRNLAKMIIEDAAAGFSQV